MAINARDPYLSISPGSGITVPAGNSMSLKLATGALTRDVGSFSVAGTGNQIEYSGDAGSGAVEASEQGAGSILRISDGVKVHIARARNGFTVRPVAEEDPRNERGFFYACVKPNGLEFSATFAFHEPDLYSRISTSALVAPYQRARIYIPGKGPVRPNDFLLKNGARPGLVWVGDLARTSLDEGAKWLLNGGLAGAEGLAIEPSLSVGRDTSNRLILPDDTQHRAVSRFHLSIKPGEDGDKGHAQIHDDSRNGVWVCVKSWTGTFRGDHIRI